MTISNIVGGFRVTGVYPIDRSVFTERTAPKESLTHETGLAFIPLYSPAHTSQKVLSFTHAVVSFTKEEIARFQARFENGYDLKHDEWYNCWLRMYHPDQVPLKPSVGVGDVPMGQSLTHQLPSLLSWEDDHIDGDIDGVLMQNCAIYYHQQVSSSSITTITASNTEA